jgi:transcription elongation GreA/GreB family factor
VKNTDDIKQLIFTEVMKIIAERIDLAKQAIESAKESRDNETKSSVGDKFETGRTLMQFEVEKSKVQLKKTEKLKSELLKINIQRKYTKVEFGSLVYTNKWNYFISIGIGKININKKEYVCISLASPIGKALYNKTENDTVSFNQSEIVISKIR